MHLALARFVTPLGETLTRRHTTDVIVEDESSAQQGALTEICRGETGRKRMLLVTVYFKATILKETSHGKGSMRKST